MYYIQETDKPNFILNKLNIIKLESDKIILPIKRNEQIKQKKARELAIKTKKILDKTNCKKLVISKQIQKQEQYINYLHTYQFNIINTKWLFELLSSKVVEYIVQKQKIESRNIQISILVNQITENMLENIKEIVQKYKKVNIVTNHIEKFKKIEKQILERYGIMITVTNNKKKSLSKSKIIINVDFPTELINKYHIYETAIIVNLKGNVKINKKRFDGININDYEISFKNVEELDNEKTKLYNIKDIYEATIYKKQPYENLMKKIKKDKVEIIELKANNSVI